MMSKPTWGASESEQNYSGQTNARLLQPLGWLPRVFRRGIPNATRNQELAHGFTSKKATVLDVSEFEEAQAEELIVHKVVNPVNTLAAVLTLNSPTYPSNYSKQPPLWSSIPEKCPD